MELVTPTVSCSFEWVDPILGRRVPGRFVRGQTLIEAGHPVLSDGREDMVEPVRVHYALAEGQAAKRPRSRSRKRAAAAA